MEPQDLHIKLKELLEGHGFSHFGWARLSPALSLTHYEKWLEDDFHGEMQYLKTHLPLKKNPDALLSNSGVPRNAESAIVVAVQYRPHPHPQKSPVENLKIASYAKGADYHHWLYDRLQEVAKILRAEFSEEEFLCATDSKPVLERDLAYRAGLGWIGKNTMLIDQARGSFFLLGEIITTLKIPVVTPAGDAFHPDRCGTCTRCIDACPTGALVQPMVMDARKCISYLTIESKNTPSLELRSKIGEHFFGCDICQDVCPWNKKIFSATTDAKVPPTAEKAPVDNQQLVSELKWILESSNGVLEKELAMTPLARARGFGLKRNAIVVAANLGLSELSKQIASYVTDARLGELASWAIEQLH